MDLFARFAQKRWKRERVDCKESPEYDGAHVRDYENTSRYVSFPYCRYCGAELEPDEFRPHSVRRVKPRWSTRMLGWFGGLKGDWWKGEK